MTPAEAGFDGAKGIRMNLPGVKDGGRFCLKRGKTTPFDYPSGDFREQLLWFYPDDAPARLLWCNAEDQWFELTFTPIAKNTSLIPPMTEQLMENLTNEEHERLLLMSEHAIAPPLSPAAKAVLTAFSAYPLHGDHIANTLMHGALPAALRAAADQLLALAAELEAPAKN